MNIAYRWLTILESGVRFLRKFGNPFHILRKRIHGESKMVRLIDRATGFDCQATFGASRMFGEVWHDHDYDIPHLPLRPGDVVMDIGANQGFYSCYAAWQGASVHAFEPFPEMVRIFEENVRRNHLESKIQVHPVALGDREGTTTLFLTPVLGGGMNTTQPSFVQGIGETFSSSMTVNQTTLSAFFQRSGIDRVRVCKIDCEGAELPILRELKPEHRAKIDAFVLEYHPQAYPMKDLLELLLGWEDFQIAFAERSLWERNILRAVSNGVLKEMF